MHRSREESRQELVDLELKKRDTRLQAVILDQWVKPRVRSTPIMERTAVLTTAYGSGRGMPAMDQPLVHCSMHPPIHCGRANFTVCMAQMVMSRFGGGVASPLTDTGP